jgi:dolichyl-phosphate beta-glucosyltransferase
MAVTLSVIIPAYNEAVRLPSYLAEVRDHLVRVYGGGHEVVVVDDGSSDGTVSVVQEFARDWPQCRLLRHPHNRGKGAAVRTGLLAARGELLLFADADGSTGIASERPLREAVERGADMAIGSRLACGPGLQRVRSWHRGVCSRLFAWVVGVALQLPVQDTQCGFKMFRRGVGHQLARLCRQQGFLFDIEVLALAHRLNYRVAEIPVSWAEVPGSKVRLVRDGWKMVRGVWRLRRALAAPAGGARRPARSTAELLGTAQEVVRPTVP